MRTTILTSLLIIALTLVSVPTSFAASGSPFPERVSTSDLLDAYRAATAGGEKFRILIVPGHEPMFGGTQFQGYYEREFVVTIAEQLKRELGSDSAFEIVIARSVTEWNGSLNRYFDREEEEIEEFIEDHKDAMARLERRGKIDDDEGAVPHNEAASDVAGRLYGITKWANENNIDLMLHLHLNDETGHAENVAGAHSGVAVYVPDEIYGNAKTSRAIAEPVFARLTTTNATSTFGGEQEGIVEDRELIAIGAFNTSEVPSLLIEYGYIYEPRITGGGARDLAFADFAYQTAQGVKDFFGSPGRPRFSSRALPAAFSSDILASSTATTTPEYAANLYSLQAALREIGFYPGTEAALSVCPVSGLMNECTTASIKAFQASKGFEQTGTVGPKTRAALNAALGTVAVPAPAPAQSCAAFTETLALDASGNDVTRLQTILAKDKTLYPEGYVTGYYGEATDRAVKRFQVAKGIAKEGSEYYGLVGPATRAALQSLCGAQ